MHGGCQEGLPIVVDLLAACRREERASDVADLCCVFQLVRVSQTHVLVIGLRKEGEVRVADLPIPSELVFSQIPSNQNIAREWCDCLPSANF